MYLFILPLLSVANDILYLDSDVYFNTWMQHINCYHSHFDRLMNPFRADINGQLNISLY